MAKAREMSEHLSDHNISRDAHFQSFYADLALAIRSPNNLDISFLKIESIYKDCTVDEGNDLPTKFTFRPAIRETFRGVLPLPIATRLAMDILDEVADLGILDLEGTREKFDEILAQIALSEAEAGEEE